MHQTTKRSFLPPLALPVFIGIFFFLPTLLSASTGEAEAPHMSHLMVQVVLQLAMILLATWLGGLAARKVGLPAPLGHLFAGMLIGPFALGSLPIPDYPAGLFAAVVGPIPVSPLLYIFSTLASITLLFLSGLETDLSLFKRYAIKGAIVGIGGVVASYIIATGLTSWLMNLEPGNPAVLFMATLTVSSSVGIAATILSARRKIDSAEGTTTLSAAVVDDILGIIILAVVLGISTQLGTNGAGTDIGKFLGQIAWIAVRAFGIWLVVTLLGLRFARNIGKGLKFVFKDHNQLAIMAFAMALMLAGVFEEVGLSLVIGAYIMGLSLSNTDLAYLIQAKLATFKDFLVPIFFAVSGMMLNFNYLLRWDVLSFGLIFAAGAIVAKLIGSGGSALFLGFNVTGALRIGFGMVPRAEVSLIIAGIGVSTGILSEAFFGVALVMMISTIIVAPPVLNYLLLLPQNGQRKTEEQSTRTDTVVDFQTREFADLLLGRFLHEMEREGFFVTHIEHEEDLYQLRKDGIFMTLTLDPDGLAHIISDEEHVALFQTALYETLLSISQATTDLKDRIKPESLVAALHDDAKPRKMDFSLIPFVSPIWVMHYMQPANKETIIAQLVDVLANAGEITDRDLVLKDVLAREASMTTGMQNGVAIPHAKTQGTNKIRIVLSVIPEGTDFQSMDGQPSRIFALIVSPKDGEGPHLQVLASIMGVLKVEANRQRLLEAKTAEEMLAVFTAKA